MTTASTHPMFGPSVSAGSALAPGERKPTSATPFDIALLRAADRPRPLVGPDFPLPSPPQASDSASPSAGCAVPCNPPTERGEHQDSPTTSEGPKEQASDSPAAAEGEAERPSRAEDSEGQGAPSPVDEPLEEAAEHAAEVVIAQSLAGVSGSAIAVQLEPAAPDENASIAIASDPTSTGLAIAAASGPAKQAGAAAAAALLAGDPGVANATELPSATHGRRRQSGQVGKTDSLAATGEQANPSIAAASSLDADSPLSGNDADTADSPNRRDPQQPAEKLLEALAVPEAVATELPVAAAASPTEPRESAPSASPPSTTTLASAADAARARLPAESLAPAPAGGRSGPAVEIDAARLLQRVARAFAAAGEGGGEITLRLSPAELGSLRVTVQVQDSQLIARLEAETPQARAALIDNLPALRERLADQGVRIERFEVDLMNRQPGGSRQQAPDQHGAATRLPPPPTPAPRSSEQPSAPRPISALPAAAGRLNVII